MDISVRAGMLKHAVRVLGRMDNEVVFEVKDGIMESRVVNIDRSVLVHVSLKSCDIHADGSQAFGVDIVDLGEFLNRADKNDIIRIDDDFVVHRGMHEHHLDIVDISLVRKCPTMSTIVSSVTVLMNGKQFKDIAAYAMDVDKSVVFCAYKDVIEFDSKNLVKQYHCSMMTSRCYKPTRCMYTTDYMHDIGIDMVVSDDVELKFDTDYPASIEYDRDGVNVYFIVAPRIDSD